LYDNYIELIATGSMHAWRSAAAVDAAAAAATGHQELVMQNSVAG
jgi:hypothetical protein